MKNEPMTFRERIQKKAAAQRHVEACTTPTDWRFLKARFGWCAACRESFKIREVILWHVRTSVAFHPLCAARVHPHMAAWIDGSRFVGRAI